MVLQLWLDAPAQLAPPFEGGGLVQVRLWLPPPQVAEQGPQSVHTPSTGQVCVLHSCETGPLQLAPPFCGGGLLQLRVCVPVLHGLLQALQSVHTPLTGQP